MGLVVGVRFVWEELIEYYEREEGIEWSGIDGWIMRLKARIFGL